MNMNAKKKALTVRIRLGHTIQSKSMSNVYTLNMASVVEVNSFRILNDGKLGYNI